MYAKLPGLHNCPGKSFVVEDGLLEKQVELNFESTNRIDLCSVKMDDENFERWKQLISGDSFVRFYFGNVVKRAALADMSTNDLYVFTDFKLSISSNEPPQYFAESSMSYALEKGQTMNITLMLKRVEFDKTEDDFGYFNSFIFLLGAIFCVCALATGYNYKVKFPSVSVVWVSSVWARSPGYKVTNMAAMFGLQCMIGVTFLFCLSCISQITLLVLVFAFITAEVIVGAVSRKTLALFCINDQKLVYYVACFCPLCLFLFESNVLWSQYVHDRFCGIGIVKLVGFSFLLTVSLWGALMLGRQFPVHTTKLPESTDKKPMKHHYVKLLTFVLTRSVWGLLFIPIIDHMCSALLNDTHVDLAFVCGIVLLHSGITSFLSVRRTAQELGMSSNMWQDCHTLAYAFSGTFNALYMLYAIAVDHDICSETFRICFGFILILSFALSATGLSVSYYTSVLVCYVLTKDFDSSASIENL